MTQVKKNKLKSFFEYTDFANNYLTNFGLIMKEVFLSLSIKTVCVSKS